MLLECYGLSMPLIASTVERKEYLFAFPIIFRVCYDVEKMVMLFLR